MNNDKTKNIEVFIKNLNIRRSIFFTICLCLAVSLPLAFYIFTVNETLSFMNLDKESYASRMSDSLLYASIMLGILLLITSPVIIIKNNMFKRYLVFIKSLSNKDIDKMIALNEKENFIYKYMPSYIIKENTVTFFAKFHQNTIYFNDIVSIDIRQTFYKGYNAFLEIKTIPDKYNYTLTGDSYKVRDLVQEIVAVNPKIFNNIQWH